MPFILLKFPLTRPAAATRGAIRAEVCFLLQEVELARSPRISFSRTPTPLRRPRHSLPLAWQSKAPVSRGVRPTACDPSANPSYQRRFALQNECDAGCVIDGEAIETRLLSWVLLAVPSSERIALHSAPTSSAVSLRAWSNPSGGVLSSAKG